ncbi:MAG: MFS transporter [Proteobacteria bacterium]|nr:MFS transporter [Pseudomonadota bacterium]
MTATEPQRAKSAESPGTGGPSRDPSRLRSGRVQFIVFTTVLIDFAGFGILIPSLPLYADRLGASAVEIALLLTVYALAQLLFLPAWGWFSDRYGRRPVILVSLAGTIGAYILLSFAEGLPGLYMARILAGFFAASIGTAHAIVTDITSPDERTQGMGQVGAAIGVGFVIGPAFGGLLMAVDEQLPFYAVAAVAAVNLGVAWRGLPETRPPAEAPNWAELRYSLVPTPIRLLSAVHDRRIGLYLYLFFHIFTAFAALEGVFPIFLGREFGATGWEIGLVFAWIGMFVVFSQGFLVGQLTRRFRESTLVAVGLFTCAVGLTAIAWAPSFGWFYVVGPIIAIGNGIAFPTFTSLYSQACAAGEAGELMGQSQAMATTGRVVGPIVAGLIMDHFFPGLSFVIAGLLLGTALVLFLSFRSLLVGEAG